jgi:hypothetical protein
MVFSHSLKTKAPHLSHIYESSQGILYLGCPHRGSDTAQYGLIAASAAQAFLQTPNKRFLRSLQTGSSDLERIADAFSLLPRKVDRSLLEFSFQEEKGMASALPLFGGKVRQCLPGFEGFTDTPRLFRMPHPNLMMEREAQVPLLQTIETCADLQMPKTETSRGSLEL